LAGHAGAQDATPAAAPFPPGVTVQPLALGLEVLPNQTDFELFRWTIAPGASFPDSPLNPAEALVYVESGSLTIEFTTPLAITTGAAMAVLPTPGVPMPPPDEIEADTTATVNAGDSFVVPLHAHGELRNEGSEPVVLLTALITPPSGELPPMALATPAA
jgi:Cupin